MFQATAKVPIEPLEREKREAERRRARDQDRAERIHHAKTRILGIDKEALDQQVREKQEKDRLEKERDRSYDQTVLQVTRTLTHVETTKTRSLRDEAKELEEFRRLQAQEKKLREQNEAVVDVAPTTVFMNFPGEDLGYSDRTKQQRQQQADWLTQQINILRDRGLNEKREQQQYESTQREITELVRQREEIMQAQKRAEQRQIMETNAQLKAMKKQKETQEAEENQIRDEEELNQALRSEFLNEVVPTRTLADPHRHGSKYLPYHFKGFNKDQLQNVLEEQRTQQEIAKAKRDEEQRREADYAAQQEAIRRQLILAEREREAARKQGLRSLQAEHTTQLKDKTLRDGQLNATYSNQIDQSFFDKFGRDCR